MTDERLERVRNFAQVPDELFIDLRVHAASVRVWGRLDKYAGKNGQAFPSRERLAQDLGMSVTGVKRALSNLADTGWIVRTQLGVGLWKTTLMDASRVASDPPQNVDGSPVTRQAGHIRPANRVTSDPHKESVRRRAIEGEELLPPASLDGSVDGLFDTDRVQAAASPVQALVGAYADAVKIAGGIPTRAMCSAIGSNLKRLIRDDHLAPPVLLLAVKRAGSRRAKTVDPYLGDVQQVFDRDRAKRDEMRASWFRMAAEIDNHQSQIGGAA
jgi:helix-turn-helix protein